MWLTLQHKTLSQNTVCSNRIFPLVKEYATRNFKDEISDDEEESIVECYAISNFAVLPSYRSLMRRRMRLPPKRPPPSAPPIVDLVSNWTITPRVLVLFSDPYSI